VADDPLFNLLKRPDIIMVGELGTEVSGLTLHPLCANEVGGAIADGSFLGTRTCASVCLEEGERSGG
jgi:hypothetical protein